MTAPRNGGLESEAGAAGDDRLDRFGCVEGFDSLVPHTRCVLASHTMRLTVRDQEIVKRAGKHGIKQPALTYEVWKNRKQKPVGFDFALVCAVLMQETAGGANVFGHDPTIFIGAGLVTKSKYLAYRKMRDAMRKFQGVGGMQLTYGGFQDQADKQGGCWTPRANYRIGFEIVRGNIARYGLWAGVAAYNGSGPAARAYANRVLAIRATFEHLLSAPRLDPEVLCEFPLGITEDMESLAQVAADQDAEKSQDPFWLPH